MLSVILTSIGLMFCQETTAFESGVARFEAAPQWLVGQSDFCTPQTVLSPNGAKAIQTPSSPPPPLLPSMITVPGQAVIRETNLLPNSARGVSPMSSCQLTYRVRTVELSFTKDGRELTKEQQGLLATLLTDKPVGVSVTRFVSQEAEGRNTQEVGQSRTAAVRKYVERLLVTRPSFVEEVQTVGTQGSEGRSILSVTAIYSSPCVERVKLPIETRSASPVQGTSEASKGGARVTQ